MDNEIIYDKVVGVLEKSEFNIPNDQGKDSYFPEYLKNILDKYESYFKENLVEYIDNIDSKRGTYIIDKISKLNTFLIEVIKLYYDGKVTDASKLFSNKFNHYLPVDFRIDSIIKKNTNFYRARKGEKQFTKKELFHIDFKLRHLVPTSRYSIPGSPALYLGDSSYVCWEELDRSKLKDLWYSKVENKIELDVLRFHRLEDLLIDLERNLDEDGSVLKLEFLQRFLILFPLTLACTIRVKNTTGNFKPEYIIPQLLSEYISNNDKLDGIMFPSSKVDYSCLHNVKAYNYVFPVKKNVEQGYCSDLTNNFHLTEPTSLELEEILSYSSKKTDTSALSETEIEIIKGQKVDYTHTSFGKIEECLNSKDVSKI